MRNEVSYGRGIFYNIAYTPHKSISPIHIYIISNEELSFTEEELASMFEYLSKDSFLYTDKEVLAPLHLSGSKYEVVSVRGGGKERFVLLHQKDM